MQQLKLEKKEIIGILQDACLTAEYDTGASPMS